MPGTFWDQVLQSQLAVPAERPLAEMTAELVTMLGSPDPHERDTVAFPVLASWVHDGVYDDLLGSLGDSLSTALDHGLGESDTDTVFRRSFSALVLGSCLDRDNTAHLLPVDHVVAWAESALTWYTRERDLRGYVPGKGWAHAVAHGADLLGTLARSRHLDGGHLGVLLDVIAERLLTPTDSVLVDGEDDRLALAALTLLRRDLLDSDRIEDWVARLTDGARHSAARPDAGPDPAQVRNTWQFLRALYLHLSLGGRPPDGPAAAPRCKPDLLLALAQAIPSSAPYLYPSLEPAP